jgi:hypothetical protein
MPFEYFGVRMGEQYTTFALGMGRSRDFTFSSWLAGLVLLL